MIRVFALLAILAALAACAPMPVGPSAQRTAERASPAADIAAQRFVAVAQTFEPVAEATCRQSTRNRDCDFLILVDDRLDQPPNAFQTLDRSGRPILAFNVALIAAVDNEDELAFVMAHEAAHHILDHLARQESNALAAATIFQGVAALTGLSEQGIREAGEFGAFVGARRFSKDFELEADRLGTVIAARAGYDPLRGAAFFNRLPEPDDQFLGTHPPNAERIRAVRQAAATLDRPS